MNERLFTPGPVEVPNAVRVAMSGSPLHHRSSEFLQLSRNVWDKLGQVFLTEQPVLVVPGSGMSGIEAAMASLHSRGEHVAILDHGRFGGRLREIAEGYGLITHTLQVEWGNAIEPESAGKFLRSLDKCDGMWLVHSETSTGVSLNLEAISSIARSVHPNILIGVDAVTSTAIEEFRMDAWNIDAAITGSQKGLMCPPGLACVALSQRAITRLEIVDNPSYTLNLKRVYESQLKGLFTWTPPTSLLMGLDVALSQILDQGLSNLWELCASYSKELRTSLVKSGISVFGDSSSQALVAIRHQKAEQLRALLLTDHRIIVAGGQDKLFGKILRLGTIGDLTLADIQQLAASVVLCDSKVGGKQ